MYQHGMTEPDDPGVAANGDTAGTVGVLLSRGKLATVLVGKRDTVYCRYAHYAQEAGVRLLFFAADGLDDGTDLVSGYVHTCDWSNGCQWTAVQAPFPGVIYDRCFGAAGRAEAAKVRAYAGARGADVVNHLPKITKLQAFEALQGIPKLEPYLPFTMPFDPETLVEAMQRFDDLYVKPDALYKGKGIYRLVRQGAGWQIRSREAWGNASWEVPEPADMQRVLQSMLDPEAAYLIQEGLTLVTYLGSRLDFRSLVQKDGQGSWTVTGLVARLAAEGSVITSPRSGGQVASAERVLRHAFPTTWGRILTNLEAASLLLAAQIEARLGPCVELGLDMAVLQDGAVKLIEVNGKPLRVSLDRLQDPLIRERINRFPIHACAFLAGTGGGQRAQALPAESAPRVGILLGSHLETLLTGPWKERYVRMSREAREAGLDPVFCAAEGIDVRAGTAAGWAEHQGGFAAVAGPLPDVIYHRATYGDRETRRHVAGMLRELKALHGVTLLNGVNSLSKHQVDEALRFFPDTAALAPATVPFTGSASLLSMLEEYPRVFLKADHGSHGSDVLCIGGTGEGWEVRGNAGGAFVQEAFPEQEQLLTFLGLVRGNQEWIIQQGIEIPRAGNRVFDLRAVLQKDGAGEWQVPLLLVRHAESGQVAANMSRGGTPYLPEAFLREFGPQLPGLESMVESATAAARKTALALEARFGLLGEIGVDIGLDRHGRPWILEANTKPLHPMLPGVWERLVQLPFRYAAYLAGRARQGRETFL